MDFKALDQLKNPPKAFDPLDGPFWADPYIGRLSLTGHLDSTSDDASRPGGKIAQENEWIRSHFPGNFKGRVLDLGCGPGLYLESLAREGWSVEGLDLNGHCIVHAQQVFKSETLSGTFRKADFLSAPWPLNQDLILCVYGTLGTISPAQEEMVWEKVSKSLAPGGLFIFDVFTKTYVETEKNKPLTQNWGAYPRGGFWSPSPHLSLVSVFEYPDLRTFLRCYSVVQDHRVRHFPFWYRWHETTDYPTRPGWEIRLFQGLGPDPWAASGDWIGVVAKKI